MNKWLVIESNSNHSLARLRYWNCFTTAERIQSIECPFNLNLLNKEMLVQLFMLPFGVVWQDDADDEQRSMIIV